MTIPCGFYIVNNVSYFNKLQAIEASLASGHEILFDWNNSFWLAQNWLQEPTESLKDLYRIRAEQIRSKYEHVALCFSGGADSLNILKTFDANNIHIDEIICWHNHSLTNNWDSMMNGEITKVAIPVAQEYISRHPTTVLTLVDQLDAFKALLDQSNDDVISMMAYSTTPSSSSMFSGSWYCTLPIFKKMIDSGKSIGLVWGVEKTQIKMSPDDPTKYAFFGFNEYVQSIQIKNTLSDYRVSDEFFYWSADLPKLLIKQCHTLKNKLNQLSADFVDPNINPVTSLRRTHMKAKNGASVSLQTINIWLYEYWNFSYFTVGKPNGSMFLSEIDSWINTAVTTDHGAKWLTIATHYLMQYTKIAKISTNWKINKEFGSKTPALVTLSYLIE
ncbi:hypothetical protein UFOVP1146_338 [uncultured Caudovirales phage]|uniref:Uncharacterized protein n=1 Tax=uncultured Caudovirales phage TaxID=2100421 RepID=A0A6J5P984_9CAUD|nr:hypothetical protein UFOVP812_251 [uncultured Caudovirales phage]CAB4165778.1 hypothetical protein UFOVP818_314 [uncultured Caudovirales phage]CAB4186992.1 hypothetical protein UFOVP1146_338 [uncultured Caudovirales phage]CAB4221252.1 hypothetical protein UFOVP1638_227 [uncultured Caudovirales phage]